MVIPAKSQNEAQTQKAKLVSSYNALLEEFSSKELHTVGNYSVGALIGKGSFGKVYLASHKLINRSKVVLKSAVKDDQNLAREIHHHRQFLHPHIARLYEVIVTETHVWLVLEYCPGDELYYYLTQNGPIEPEKVKKIFTQLVGAVSYVHQKSCVHRDLKLENILLDKNEDVKLCDFGFTREYEGKSSYLQTWCGTICYAAPEMLKGEKYAGEKVDVWSLGIILYALLCGELPFDEDDDKQTKMKILKEEPKYPTTMPTQARDLCNLLLSKRPLLRPSLADILTNPWLMDHASVQQAILKVQQPPPFTTQLETDTLQRMRSAGVNIDAVIENVLSQRCDGLAGWWAILLEKEQRKEQRKQKKRKDKEADVKANRRISTASGRLLASTIKEADEEKSSYGGSTHALDSLDNRGRSPHRARGMETPPSATNLEAPKQSPPQAKNGSYPLKPPEYRFMRPPSTSRTRRRSDISMLGPGIPPSKRNSVLQVVTTDANNVVQQQEVTTGKKRKRKYQPLFFTHHLSSIKSWFRDPGKRLTKGHPGGPPAGTQSSPHQQNISRSHELNRISSDITPASAGLDLRPSMVQRNTYPTRPRVTTTARSSHSRNRLSSQSPSPITPRSSYRRSGGGSGLRGRKSTSSSVSSIRSFATNPPGAGQASSNYPPNPYGHSKASSASSGTTSIGSPSNLVPSNPSTQAQQQRRRRSSPNIDPNPSSFIKVIPGHASPSPGANPLPRISTQSANTPPINKRIPPRINLNNTDPNTSSPTPVAAGTITSPNPLSSFGPPSPGLAQFARRKRTPFRGPNLLGPGRRRSDGTGDPTTAGVTPSAPSSGSGQSTITEGQPTLIAVGEEDEDEDAFEDIEGDAFPLMSEPGNASAGAEAGLWEVAENEEEGSRNNSTIGVGPAGHLRAVGEGIGDQNEGIAVIQGPYPHARGGLRESVEFPSEMRTVKHSFEKENYGTERPLTKWELEQ